MNAISRLQLKDCYQCITVHIKWMKLNINVIIMTVSLKQIKSDIWKTIRDDTKRLNRLHVFGRHVSQVSILRVIWIDIWEFTAIVGLTRANGPDVRRPLRVRQNSYDTNGYIREKSLISVNGLTVTALFQTLLHFQRICFHTKALKSLFVIILNVVKLSPEARNWENIQ